VGEAAFSGGLSRWLVSLGAPEGVASVAATAIVVAVITFVTIIFGELVPKRIGQLYPEQVSRLVSRPMAWLARAAGPFVKLLSATTQATLMLLRIDTTQTRGMTEEEIAHSLEEGVDAGVIEAQEHQMVRNLFHLDDRALTSMMVPRSDIEWLEATATVADALRLAGQGGAHSWYPVCRGSLDDVVGVVSVSRLISLGPEHEGAVEPHAEVASFVPETLTGMELLDNFRASGGDVAFVVDEYGEVQGMVTFNDVIEAITGQLKPRRAEDAWAIQRDDGTWLLDGLIPLPDLMDRLAIEALPEEESGKYHTLSGMVLLLLGRLPATGDHVEWAGWRLEVVDMDGRRIDKVLATRTSKDDSQGKAG